MSLALKGIPMYYMHVPTNQFPHYHIYPQNQHKNLSQAYLQNIHATFGGSLTLITDNGGELKKLLFQKVTHVLQIKDQLTSPCHLQLTRILEKCHSFLKACIRKHIPSKLDWEDTIQYFHFSYRMLPGIFSRESSLFLLFG